MKKFLTPLLFLSSCAPNNYYQVYETIANGATIVNDRVVFEDAGCRVSYDLWSHGGNVSFVIFNKTEKEMTLDLTRSFFILNDFVYEYYQNRTYTNSSGSITGVTVYSQGSRINSGVARTGTGISTKKASVILTEKPQITMPAKTKVLINGYSITDTRLAHPGLTPTPYDSVMTAFDTETSPYVFRNSISYITAGDTIKMENRFYVSSIMNYQQESIITWVETDENGRELNAPTPVLNKLSPNKFYIRYKP